MNKEEIIVITLEEYNDLVNEYNELYKENKKYKEVIEKIKDIFDNGTFEDGCDCILIEELLEDKEVE